jgi:serine-protein kinase ATM
MPICVLGPVAQAIYRSRSVRPIAEYVLLLEHPRMAYNDKSHCRFSQPSADKFAAQQPLSLETRILEGILIEVERTTHNLLEVASERPQILSQTMLQTITTLCIVSYAIAHMVHSSNAKFTERIENATDSLARILSKFLGRVETEQTQIDGILDVFCTILPDPSQADGLKDDLFDSLGLSRFSLHISRAWDVRNARKSHSQSDNMDLMDLDDDFGTQQSHDMQNSQSQDIPRTHIAVTYDVSAFRTCTANYIHLISSMVEGTEDDSMEIDDLIPSKFIDRVLQISDKELITLRPLLDKILSSSLRLRVEDAYSLFLRIGEPMLFPYEYNRSEAVHLLCIDIMKGTVDLWSSETKKDLYDSAADIYDWFVATVVKVGFASPTVQVRLSELLFLLLDGHADYAKALNLPSVRTTLFDLVKDGEVPVKYLIGQQLPAIFDHFVLSIHEDIFEDILVSLPTDDKWEEGIAVRLFILAKLGSSWHTLLRKCVYHIFETAGFVPVSVLHAIICMESLSRTLSLESPTALFQIFAPQLLHTFLERQPLEKIPYSIFKYSSLVALLEDVQDEVFGQAAMQGNDELIETLIQALKSSQQDILKRAFAKAVAYCISSDIKGGKSRDTQSESKLRLMLGNENFDEMMQSHIAHILGIMFIHMEQQQGDLAERRLSDVDAFKSASQNVREIREYSTSSDELPAVQQPSFPAKILPHQISRAIIRSRYKLDGFWTPSIFVYIMRMLLAQMIPALGSLHACTMIRKIRVLIGIAGNIPLDGYPLQMSLHALRPFLADSHCSEDTLGVVQYLLHHGRSSLVMHFSFMAGIGLSILMSLRAFLASSQASTTQESQFRASMSKAQAFHAWFSNYLEEYQIEAKGADLQSKNRESQFEFFRVIMRAAGGVRSNGNSIKGTAESRLLMALLEDDRRERKLLSEPAHAQAFSLLCRSFQEPTKLEDDILGADRDAVALATQVVRSCRQREVGDEYINWAAKVIGRSFSMQGDINQAFRKVTRQIMLPTTSVLSKGGVTTLSRAAIIQILLDLMFSVQQAEVGLAEDALRHIIAKSTTSEDTSEVAIIIPQEIVDSLSLPASKSVENRKVLQIYEIQDTAFPGTIWDFTEWMQVFGIALAQAGSEDPVLSSLPGILAGIPDSSERVFPFLLHLVLRRHFGDRRGIRSAISHAFNTWFEKCNNDSLRQVRNILKAVLYLRTQPVPKETTRLDRDHWLDIDYCKAAGAAARCGSYREALLFMEIYASQSQRSIRRSSHASTVTVPQDLQLTIYRNLEEPDSYYGIEQDPSMGSILSRLDYERDGNGSLLFRGAKMDSEFKRKRRIDKDDTLGLLKSMMTLNLNSVTDALLSSHYSRDLGTEVIDATLHTARKLEKWDIRLPEKNSSEESICFRAFQGLYNSNDLAAARRHVNNGLITTMKNLLGSSRQMSSMDAILRTLAVLTEADEILSTGSGGDVKETWERLQDRDEWKQNGRQVCETQNSKIVATD